ncbi:uncharacterized protein LOC131316808 [Rhododendron vialii]|uniref:uncharacterized protein LOC131316808 n=1 Tax=Rhododendron vialii TaxID=182163 RepID=UPI00265D6286|nr:uncharacterized protein LOC131316808 [Rhododendron vialii]
MPPMKIQPLDSQAYNESLIRNTDAAKPVLKSRLKRLFDRQFPSVLRNNSSAATAAEFEPSSVCLAKMVQNFIEESQDSKSAAKCGRNRCNCFNGNINDSSDDEFDVSSGFNESGTSPSAVDSLEMLKSLIPCASVDERHLLAETSKIVEKNKICEKKDLRKIVTDGLLLLGYDASICKSRWEKSPGPSFPAGEYEYIDVIAEAERVIIDVDFRSEFGIARPTGGYKLILQSLPLIFVGRSDRLQQIVSIASEAANQSLKKKGMHVPPWRKVEYMRAKWLSSHTRTAAAAAPQNDVVDEAEKIELVRAESEGGELELIFGEKTAAAEVNSAETEAEATGDGGLFPAMACPWKPPAVKPKRCERGGAKVVTGLASLLREKP